MECPVGRNIHYVLDEKLKRVQKAMEQEMETIKRKAVIIDITTKQWYIILTMCNNYSYNSENKSYSGGNFHESSGSMCKRKSRNTGS